MAYSVRPVLPRGDLNRVVAPFNKDGRYFQVAQGTKGISIRKEHMVMRGGRAGYITDEPPAIYEDFSMVDVLTTMEASDDPENPKKRSNWAKRLHALRNARFVRCRGVDKTRADSGLNYCREHDNYFEHADGELLIEDCSSLNFGAQALQIRLKFNAADVRWKWARHLVVPRYNAQECGQLRGAGRAGFSISIKDYGPNGEIDLIDPFVRTINQTAVKTVTINKKPYSYDSFGGICVEFCKRLSLTGGYVEMKNPDRHAVQLFNDLSGLTNPKGCAPLDLTVHDLEVARGGHMAVRVEADTQRIDIRGCKGSGSIKVFKRGADGVYRIDRTIPITQGYVL